MKYGIAYPLGAIKAGISDIVGWTILLLASTAIGFALGYSLGRHQLCGPVTTLEAFCLFLVVWLFAPGLATGFIVTPLTWLAFAHRESTILRLAGAVCNLLTWLIVAYFYGSLF